MTLIKHLDAVLNALGTLSRANSAYLKSVKDQGEGGGQLYLDLTDATRDGGYIRDRRNISIILYDRLGDRDSSSSRAAGGPVDYGTPLTTVRDKASRDDLLRQVGVVESHERTLRNCLVALNAYIYTIAASEDGGVAERTRRALNIWEDARRGLAKFVQSLAYGSVGGMVGPCQYMVHSVSDCTGHVDIWMTDIARYKKLVELETSLFSRPGRRKLGTVLGMSTIRATALWRGYMHFTAGGYGVPGRLETFLAVTTGCNRAQWRTWPPELLESSKTAAEPNTRRRWISPGLLIKSGMILRQYGQSMVHPAWRAVTHRVLPYDKSVLPGDAQLTTLADAEPAELPFLLLHYTRLCMDAGTPEPMRRLAGSTPPALADLPVAPCPAQTSDSATGGRGGHVTPAW